MHNTIKINFILGCLTGLVIFVMLFGFKPVNPVNIDWISTTSFDIATYQSGWEFFRNEKWHIIPGLITSATYPFATSILNLDIIPLVAIPLKLISALLPEKFQYFGLWLLMCFILQGGFAAIIFGKYIKNTAVIIIGTIIIVCMPAFILRTFIHISLCAYFLILAAIALYVYKENLKYKTIIILWNILLCCSVAVHPYITLMVYVIMLSFCLYDYLKNRNFVLSLKLFITTVFSMIITVFILGMNSMLAIASVRDFVYLVKHSSYLHSLINPANKYVSAFIQVRYEPYVSSLKNYETIYIGLGIIFLLVFSLFMYLSKFHKKVFNKNFFIGVSCGMIFLFVFATYPVIAFDNFFVIQLKIPSLLEHIMEIFRAHNRMMLPVMYIIVFLSFIFVAVNMKKNKMLIPFFVFILFIQIADLYPMFKFKSSEWNKAAGDIIPRTNRMVSGRWNDIAKTYRHMIFIDHINMFDTFIMSYASNNKLTFNKGALSRIPYKQRKEEIYNNIEKLRNNNLPEDTFLILNGNDAYLLCEIDIEAAKKELLNGTKLSKQIINIMNLTENTINNITEKSLADALNSGEILNNKDLYLQIENEINQPAAKKILEMRKYRKVVFYEDYVEYVKKLNKLILYEQYPEMLKYSFTAANLNIPKMNSNEKKNFEVINLDGFIVILPYQNGADIEKHS